MVPLRIDQVNGSPASVTGRLADDAGREAMGEV
jgi:hypothetical protein